MNDLVRQQVYEIEEWIRTLPPVDIPVRHYFSPGVYAREITIPAGTALTGKIHKYAQLNILSKGEISVTIDHEVRRIKAPFAFVAPPGTKRAAYVHEEAVWTTIHGTDETDLEKIEAHFIAQDEQEYLTFRKQIEVEGTKCLG